jgi:hypothetical protein
MCPKITKSFFNDKQTCRKIRREHGGQGNVNIMLAAITTNPGESV